MERYSTSMHDSAQTIEFSRVQFVLGKTEKRRPCLQCAYVGHPKIAITSPFGTRRTRRRFTRYCRITHNLNNYNGICRKGRLRPSDRLPVVVVFHHSQLPEFKTLISTSNVTINDMKHCRNRMLPLTRALVPHSLNKLLVMGRKNHQHRRWTMDDAERLH
jgi:hypothetical protein